LRSTKRVIMLCFGAFAIPMPWIAAKEILRDTY
jgi:hypothetical protein